MNVELRLIDNRSESETGSEPKCPTSIAATKLNETNLIKLALKAMFVRGIESPRDIAEMTALHIGVCKEIMEFARDQGLLEVLGSDDVGGYSSFRYGLTAAGREAAGGALMQNQYIGPAPVTLDEYREQVDRQSVLNAGMDRETLTEKLSHLVLPPTMGRSLGPAINSGRSLLLYGAPGNGKTSIAEAVANALPGSVKIPNCIEVDGEIIKVFDPIIHKEIVANGGEKAHRWEFTDRRWRECRRPVVIVGGELTLDMLDLSYSMTSKFYEAPLQMKANGGTFLIDDLGRQLVNPKDLLNRWIMPMERRIDFMVLNNGGSFSVPFDNLLIFSTNLEPADLMDPAFLRRIPYKVEVLEPTDDEFKTVFFAMCRKYGLPEDDTVADAVIKEIRAKCPGGIGFYQPKFILDQVVAACKFDGQEAALDRDFLSAAIDNISAKRAV